MNDPWEPRDTQNTRPRVFEGLESCQRSLDEDYTSSATDFNKSKRVALEPPPPTPPGGRGGTEEQGGASGNPDQRTQENFRARRWAGLGMGGTTPPPHPKILALAFSGRSRVVKGV